jgi:hypothetical protein
MAARCRHRRRWRRLRSGRWRRPSSWCRRRTGQFEHADRAVPDDGAGVGDDFGRSLAAVFGPMSRMRSWAVRRRRRSCWHGPVAETSSATTTSTRQRHFGAGRLHDVHDGVGFLDQVGSASDSPMRLPEASRKVLAMPPPTISWSTLSASDLRMVSLEDTLEPADDGHQRALRCVQGLAQRIDFGAHQHAGAGHRGKAGDAVGGGFGAVGGAEGIVDVDVAQGLAIFWASSSLSFFSPLLQRQFSSSTTSPGATLEATVHPVLDHRTGFAASGQAHGHRARVSSASVRLRWGDPGGR